MSSLSVIFADVLLLFWQEFMFFNIYLKQKKTPKNRDVDRLHIEKFPILSLWINSVITFLIPSLCTHKKILNF